MIYLNDNEIHDNKFVHDNDKIWLKLFTLFNAFLTNKIQV